MTESLSNQFDGMLPGVDWSGYKPPTAPPGYSIDPTAHAEQARIENYQKEFPNFRWNPFLGRREDIDTKEYREADLAKADVPLEGLHSARTFYTPEQEAEVSTALEKINRVAKKRTPPGTIVPEGIRVRHSVHSETDTGERFYNLELHDPELLREGHDSEVGQVKWFGNTGKVGWLGVDEGYRHLLPNLLSRAHSLAAEHGDTGPTKSHELTSYSYNLMQKHAPSFIDRENTTVDYEPLDEEPHR